jgi:large subunit GTPase 1
VHRRIWGDYFDAQGIQYAFFSAANAAALQQARREALPRSETEIDASERRQHPDAIESNTNPNTYAEPESSSDSEGPHTPHDDDDGESDPPDSDVDSDSDEERLRYVPTEEDTPDGRDPRTKVLSVLELEDLFATAAPDLSSMPTPPILVTQNLTVLYTAFKGPSGEPPTKLVVGLVGYPNVGKSSTINALLGEKKVSVSSTPGKTKHFQTIHLSPSIVLCDCPGLVFPQFTTTKAALVCDGVLPIDQMREHTGPVALVVKRMPKEVLEATYGLSIRVRGIEEGGDGKVSAEDFLVAYASTLPSSLNVPFTNGCTCA